MGQGMRGQRVVGAWVDEIHLMQPYDVPATGPLDDDTERRIREMVDRSTPGGIGQRVAMENTLREKERQRLMRETKQEPRVFPPHDRDVDLLPYDEVVILGGDQEGWRGRVVQIDRGLRGVGSDVVVVDMVRPDGTKASRVSHRREFVAKVLDRVPQFTSAHEAEAWLETQHRGGPLPQFAVGTRVIFSCPPHLAQRMCPADRRREKREWLRRHDDLEVEGRVTKFMPWWEKDVPGYELLVLLDEEPELVEVAARRVLRLA